MSPPVTIVAVHGNGGGGFRFARTEEHIVGDIAFHAVTLPGFAREPRDPQLRSLRGYAGHLCRLLEDKSRPRILLGHGLGGSIVLEFLQHFSTTVDGAILHAPVGSRLRRRWFPRLMSVSPLRYLGQRLLSSPWLRPLFTKMLFTRPIPSPYLDRFFEEYRHCRVFADMFDLVTCDWFTSLRPVHIPAVLLWGRRERVLDVDQLHDYRKLLPHSSLRIVDDWDHFPMIEQPRQYAREVMQLAQKLAWET